MNARAYTFSWAILGLIAGLSVVIACSAARWAGLAQAELVARNASNEADARAISRYKQELAGNDESAGQVSKFLSAWEPYINPFADKKDRQSAILRVLEDEAIALQDLLVGTKVTPVAKTYRFGDQTLDVEQVQMKVSGPLSKTMVFLGRIEEQFPYARVTRWLLEPTEAGHGVSLDFKLVQPVHLKNP